MNSAEYVDQQTKKLKSGWIPLSSAALESVINANVLSPEVYPAGWKKIPVPNEAEGEE